MNVRTSALRGHDDHRRDAASDCAPCAAFGDGPRRLLPLAVAVLVFAPHVLFQPAPIVLGTLIGLVWSALTISGIARTPSRIVLFLLAAAAVGVVLQQYGRLWGQEAGTALLLLMAALKLLEARETRDFEVFLFLAYFVVATQYFFDQAIWIAAQSILAVWLITASLAALHSSDHTPLRALIQRSGWMLVHAIPIMLVLFVVFPRIQGAALSLPTPSGAMTGLSEDMRPGEISELIQREGVVARVRFDGPVPGPVDQYWRAIVLTDYDGRRWTRANEAPSAGGATRPGQYDSALANGGQAPAGVPLQYSVNLEPTRPPFVPLLETAAAWPVHTAGGDWSWLNDGSLRANRPLDQRVRYDTAAWIGAPNPVLQTELDERAYTRLTALPASAAPRSRQLLDQWRLELELPTRDSDNPNARLSESEAWALIQRALQHFGSDPFRYTLRPPRTPGDTTDAFLFETRAGFCEDYAAAFAVLMRAAGLPTRIVTGYQGGRLSDRGGYLLLRYADAHAWNEVWIEGRGWVRVDPTAAIAPERIERSIDEFLAGEDDLPIFLRGGQGGLDFWTRARLEWMDWRDWVEYRWTSWVLAFDPERQRDLFARLGLDFNDWRHILTALLGMIAAGGLVILAWWALQRWRARPDPLVRRARRLARQIQRTVERLDARTSADSSASPQAEPSALPRVDDATAPRQGTARRTMATTTPNNALLQPAIDATGAPPAQAALHRWIDWARPVLAQHDRETLTALEALAVTYDRAFYGPPATRAQAREAFITGAQTLTQHLRALQRQTTAAPPDEPAATPHA